MTKTKLPRKILQNLIGLNPVSIIITGSAASGESGKKSDIDIMVIFKDSNYVNRRALKKFATGKVRIYPFRLNELKKQKSPHPFPIRFYFWWLFSNSKVIYGNRPKILNHILTNKDLKDVLSFERGVALSAMHSLRNNDQETARISFVKSCLFGATAGIGLLKKYPPKNYSDTVRLGTKIFPQHSWLIRRANKIRKNGGRITEHDIFKNIEFLHYIALKI